MASIDTFPSRPIATVGDFFALLKPRVMSLVVFTGLAGIVVAPGSVNPLTAFTALLCIAVGAGASGALNMAYDSDIDALMSRTAGRPIPMGKIARGDVLGFGYTLSIASVANATAVSKPKQFVVPTMSLSIVFGTPTIGMPIF